MAGRSDCVKPGNRVNANDDHGWQRPPLEEIEMERLFVYGSLAPGRPNEHILAGVTGSWEAASVMGTLREEGWGAAMGFPGLDLDTHGETIEGLMFSSDELAVHWAALDAFEGDAYIRTPAAVRLASGDTVEAYVYALKK
jgi:gamma-glutamylcyclotransferase (GGCT)/AIG2-like uncharacterized protein YtfP